MSSARPGPVRSGAALRSRRARPGFCQARPGFCRGVEAALEVVGLGLGARVAAERVEGDLGWVAAADEDAESAVALGAVGRRVGAAAAEQLERGCHLLLRILGGEGGVDVLAVDAELAEAAGDSVGA